METVRSLTLMLGVVLCISFPSELSANCINFDDSCRNCIQQPGCQWCSEKTNSSDDQHCFPNDQQLNKDCLGVVNKENSNITYLEDKELSEVTKETIHDIVQLKPQKIKIKLRKGVPKNITLYYRQIANYPLDLYYLMDLSQSMADDKKNLAKLGKDLADKMLNLTSEFQIGFGSFVDKVMAPFVNIHPKSLKSPCKKDVCDTPFSFRNNLVLTKNHGAFTTKVNETKISTNLDSPEGGFDALMQVMVCEKKIGWRENVRKIIVLSTDAPFHLAGDGKLAGVVTPNDQRCHLNKEGMYDQYDVYDYPSIGQIEKVAEEKGINIIFAVKTYQNLYKQLADRIHGATQVRLEDNSNNVVNIIGDVYNSITGKVELTRKGEEKESPVSLRYFSSCNQENKSPTETNTCSGVKEGITFEFTVELTLEKCPKDGNHTTIKIGTLQDELDIEIEYLCECECDADTDKGYVRNSPDCNRKGTKKCDVCECNPGHKGKTCQCSQDSNNVETTKTIDRKKCRPANSSATDSVCSGRGYCECEVCICDTNEYSGKHCQCDKGMCRQTLDESEKECSGHGECNCNTCTCNGGRAGQFCQCKDNRACINKGDDGKKCSGNGHCECGRCECDVTYTGKFCEDCADCGLGKCLYFKDYVQYDVHQSGSMSIVEYKKFKQQNEGIVIHRHTLLNTDEMSDDSRQCSFTDDDTECDFIFTYKYITTEEKYEINAQRTQECRERANLVAIGFGVICAVVAIGILTLIIWKLVTSYHDKKEFEKFRRLTDNPEWNEVNTNVLYENTVSEVQNPAFMGKKG